jgi:RHS repeat-associated protein
LQRLDGSLAEWVRYSAFGEKTILVAQQSLFNPWCFANRREISDLSLFSHRLYNSSLMRWQTTDPLGFKDGLNLYAYVHNNPFAYKDPDGQFAIAIPLFTLAFNGTLITVTLTEIAYALAAAGTFLALNNVDKLTDQKESSLDANIREKEDPKKRYKEDKFPGTDKDLANHPDWRETTHPNQRKAGHREFENTQTGEKIRFDKGDPTRYGHEAYDHYHRYNPKSTNKHDQYLDKDGNSVRRGDDKSHLYPPDGIYWEF